MQILSYLATRPYFFSSLKNYIASNYCFLSTSYVFLASKPHYIATTYIFLATPTQLDIKVIGLSQFPPPIEAHFAQIPIEIRTYIRL